MDSLELKQMKKQGFHSVKLQSFARLLSTTPKTAPDSMNS